jgi:hypothetical protein
MPDPVVLTNLVLVGEFDTFTKWVNKSRSWTAGRNYLFIDRFGRLCQNCENMMRARDSDAFPVRFYGQETSED